MVFSSLIFLCAFFPLSLLFYSFCKTQKAQNAVLLIFSLVFYAWGEPKYVLLLMLMAFVSWLCALCIAPARSIRAKQALVLTAAVIDIGLIGFFKYSGLICSIFGPVPEFISRIALPIGISFYTFQLLTYVVDVYRREAPAQRSYWNVLLYAALFHQCVAGPIVRYRTISRDLFSGKPRQCRWDLGVSRFCSGLAKKVLLANPLGALANSIILTDSAIADPALFAANAEALGNLSVLGAWLGLAAYALHIYLDFSAYSDMAIGMGWMLGLHYPENFNYPYIARTVTEFWRRWHISLGTFFRDYVYIPLGGNRRSLFRSIFNTLTVWLLTGLWHGASWNFLLWGLWFFVFLMLERLVLKRILEKIPLLSNLYLLLVVALGWVIFRYTNLNLGLILVRSLFGANGNPLTSFASTIQLKSNIYLLAVAFLASTPLMKYTRQILEHFSHRHGNLGVYWDVIFYSVIPICLFLLSLACLVGDTYNPFIYFQF